MLNKSARFSTILQLAMLCFLILYPLQGNTESSVELESFEDSDGPEDERRIARILNLMTRFHAPDPDLLRKEVCKLGNPLEPKESCAHRFENFCKHIIDEKKFNGGGLQHGFADNGVLNPIRNSLISIQTAIRRSTLPKNLQNELIDNGLPEKLDKVIEGEFRGPLEELLLRNRSIKEIEQTIVESIETVVLRELYDEGETVIGAVPHHIRFEIARRKNRLMIAFNEGVWREDKSWIRIREQFKMARAAAKEWVNNKSGISDELRAKWLRRVNEMEFNPPGTDQFHYLENLSCSLGLVNAHYLFATNTVTACGGVLFDKSQKALLAHEIGHALANSMGRFEHIRDSAFAKDLADIATRTCKEKPLSCTEWNEFKSKFGSSLIELSEFKVDLPKLNRCLLDQPIKAKSPMLTYQIGQEYAENMIAYLAQEDAFTSLTNKVLPSTIFGNYYKNPNFLNTCNLNTLELNGHIDHGEAASLFFIYEYRCSDPAISELNRLDSSIEGSKKMMSAFYAAMVAMGGDYSTDYRMNLRGVADDLEEKMADQIGGEILAVLTQQRGSTDHYYKEASLLEDLAIFCVFDSPYERAFPKESVVQGKHYYHLHSISKKRRREILSVEPLREQLGCNADTNSTDCTNSY